jgi:oligopeptidase B
MRGVILPVRLLVLALAIVVVGCGSTAPPRARVVPHELDAHGDVRVDDYYWLNQRDDPEVIAYLEAENDYLRRSLAHTEDLQQALFEEMKGRLKQDDASVPYREDGYWYYTRYEEGQEYPIHCRREGTLDAPEEVLLDVNELAVGHEFCAVRGVQPSPDGRLLGFGIDTVGRRFYTLRFKDLATGRLLDDVIPDMTRNFVWAADSRTVFYSRQDPQTLRAHRIYRHVLGGDPADDALVYEETDDTFSCYVTRTQDRRYLLIGCDQTLATEYRYLDASRPDGEWTLFLPRERDHEYGIDHLHDTWYVRTNWQATNFRLMACGDGDTSREAWREVIPHRPEVYLQAYELFRDHLVLLERADGLRHLRIRRWDGSDDHYLDFGEPAYMAYIGTNRESDTTVLRYGYSSLTTPWSTFDYDMDTREKTLLKEEPVLGGFDKTQYRTERLWATARDGTRVPISLVYRVGFRRDGTAPLLLYGYGSYGSSMDATFSSERLSLLDRGFVYAIAHVRGGQEMGRRWYEDGKLLHKKNTFTDFIDCGRYLVAEQYCAPDRLFAMGGSAGGLLMGAVANMAPDLWRGIVAEVPWVDCVTTMLDPSIPLTTAEYDEWGDPNVKEYYDYILSYSPYDNVTAQDYPAMLVTTGLHDSQVQYFEPAKWVAKLRRLKTDENRLLLYTNMEAGHGGATGRFKSLKETALAYAFLLDQLGIDE